MADFQVVIDCADPDRVARFWAEALGYQLQPPPEGFESWDSFLDEMGVAEEERNSASAIVDPEGRLPRVYFQRVPEPKSVKNRVHLDVNVGGGRGTPLEERLERLQAEIGRLEALGATVVRPLERSELDEYWVVMQDPEGNEFCLQ